MFTSSNLVLGSSSVWLVSVTGPQLATTPLPQPQRQLQITAGSLGISVCYGFVFGFVPVYFCIFNLYFFTCPPLHISFVFFFVAFFGLLLSIYLCLCVFLPSLPRPQSSCTKLPTSLASVFWGRELVPGYQKAMLLKPSLYFGFSDRFSRGLFIEDSAREDMIG